MPTKLARHTLRLAVSNNGVEKRDAESCGAAMGALLDASRRQQQIKLAARPLNQRYEHSREPRSGSVLFWGRPVLSGTLPPH